MVKNSKLTYGQNIIKAREQTDRQEVGETLHALLKYFKNLLEDICNEQAEMCLRKGFDLKKYYIWIGLRKDSLAANVLHISPLVRYTRPIPDDEIFKDHFLWSVTNMNQVVFEWNHIGNELANYIIHNKPSFEIDTVSNAIKQQTGKIDKIEDYVIDGKLT
jgi:hypothetical protein